MKIKSLLLIPITFITLTFVSCGGKDNDDDINTPGKGICNYDEKLTELTNNLTTALNEYINDLESPVKCNAYVDATDEYIKAIVDYLDGNCFPASVKQDYKDALEEWKVTYEEAKSDCDAIGTE